MTPWVAAALFVAGLAVTLGASDALVRGLDRLGARIGLSEGLLGLLTALGADAPEISSALAALHAGAPNVGLGVVLGSNVFNLAALLGLGALAAGSVRVHVQGLALDGGVAAAITLVIVALVLHVLAPLPAVALVAAIFVPYLLLLGLRPGRIERFAPARLARALARAVREVDEEAAEDPRVGKAAGQWRAALLIPLALALIVGGSAVMVAAALALAADWHVPQALVGSVALAGLTSLPNAYAAVRLALAGRGAAVVSETLNSNTINLLAGVAIPAAILGRGILGTSDALDLAWLVGMTAASLLLLARRRGLTRPGGALLVAAYLAFVVVRVRA